MKTKDKRKSEFERRPQFRNFIYFTEFGEGADKKNQNFVVPWQMVESSTKKYVIE